MDTGIRNVLKCTYSSKALLDARDLGLMAETIVHNHLKTYASNFESYRSNCFYWKNNCEIDNIISIGKKPIPIEVKFQNEVHGEDAKGCIEFTEKYSSPFGILVTKNKLDFKDKMLFIPLWYFLLLC